MQQGAPAQTSPTSAGTSQLPQGTPAQMASTTATSAQPQTPPLAVSRAAMPVKARGEGVEDTAGPSKPTGSKADGDTEQVCSSLTVACSELTHLLQP